MILTKRLMQVFKIQIEMCSECGGAVKVIACVEDPVFIKKLVTNLNGKVASVVTGLLREGRTQVALAQDRNDAPSELEF